MAACVSAEDLKSSYCFGANPTVETFDDSVAACAAAQPTILVGGKRFCKISEIQNLKDLKFKFWKTSYTIVDIVGRRSCNSICWSSEFVIDVRESFKDRINKVQFIGVGGKVGYIAVYLSSNNGGQEQPNVFSVFDNIEIPKRAACFWDIDDYREKI